MYKLQKNKKAAFTFHKRPKFQYNRKILIYATRYEQLYSKKANQAREKAKSLNSSDNKTQKIAYICISYLFIENIVFSAECLLRASLGFRCLVPFSAVGRLRPPRTHAARLGRLRTTPLALGGEGRP